MRPRMYIGLATTFHEPAIAILDGDGRVVFAEATERHLQSKRGLVHPADGIEHMPELLERYCDPDAELVLATSWSRGALGALWLGSITGRYTLGSVRSHAMRRNRMLMRKYHVPVFSSQMYYGQRSAGIGTLYAAAETFGHQRVTLRRYDHHLTHAVHACHVSPFDEAVCVVVDGVGESGSAALYHYHDGELRRFGPRHSLASLGMLYMYVTELCGFDPRLGEEWKVMGLAPHGTADADVCALMHELLSTAGGKLKLAPRRQFHRALQRLDALRTCIDDDFAGAANLAAAGQQVFAEILGDLLRTVAERGVSKNLVFCGGAALNSSFNGTAIECTGFEQLSVPAAPADDGNALGAALLACREDGAEPEPVAGYPYLGTEIAPLTPLQVQRLGRTVRVQHLPDSLAEETVQRLAEGKIVAWVQGRAEFGPRALGNRSILADPRDAAMRDRINAGVKGREAYRPFAPAILHEYGPEYFEHYQESPYMERTLRFTAAGLERAPATAHVDGTGRLQSVRAERSPQFAALLRAFFEKTGVPVLLNTSLNVMGKPMVHSLEDALAVFHATDLDVLVVGEHLLEKYH